MVFGKEFKDGRRDKRAVLSAFIFPILAPILVYGMMSFMINLKTQAEETVIPVIGIDNAPAFIRWLKEKDVKVESFDGDPREAVKNKVKELVVVIPDNYEEKFRATRTAVIEIVNDGFTHRCPRHRRSLSRARQKI